MPAPRQHVGPKSPLPLRLSVGTITIVGILLFGILFAVNAVRSAIKVNREAEMRLQAGFLVCDLIAEHVEKSPTNAWPTSWSDLEHLPPRPWAGGDWPSTSPQVRSLIAVDFTLDTHKVLKSTPATFTGIANSPGPNFGGIRQSTILELFARLHKAENSHTPDGLDR